MASDIISLIEEMGADKLITVELH